MGLRADLLEPAPRRRVDGTSLTTTSLERRFLLG